MHYASSYAVHLLHGGTGCRVVLSQIQQRQRLSGCNPTLALFEVIYEYMMGTPNSQYELTNMLFKLYTPDLKQPAKALLCYLSHFGDSLGGSIYPSINTIASDMCMCKRAVINNLQDLEDKKYIAVKKGGVFKGQNVTNQYKINLKKLEKKTSTASIKVEPAPTEVEECYVQVNGRYMTIKEAKASGYTES